MNPLSENEKSSTDGDSSSLSVEDFTVCCTEIETNNDVTPDVTTNNIVTELENDQGEQTPAGMNDQMPVNVSSLLGIST